MLKPMVFAISFIASIKVQVEGNPALCNDMLTLASCSLHIARYTGGGNMDYYSLMDIDGFCKGVEQAKKCLGDSDCKDLMAAYFYICGEGKQVYEDNRQCLNENNKLFRPKCYTKSHECTNVKKALTCYNENVESYCGKEVADVLHKTEMMGAKLLCPDIEKEDEKVTKEEPKKEEPNKEEPKKEDPKKEEPKEEEPKKEEPKKEEPKNEEPKKEEPKKEEPKKEEPKKDEPKEEPEEKEPKEEPKNESKPDDHKKEESKKDKTPNDPKKDKESSSNALCISLFVLITSIVGTLALS